MGRKPVQMSEVSRRAAELLRDAAQERGVPNVRIAEKVGLSESTISRIFALSRPITIAELDDIAAAIGLDGWEVLRDASR